VRKKPGFMREKFIGNSSAIMLDRLPGILFKSD